MRFKSLLFSLVLLVGISTGAQAKILEANQDTIKGLIFSETAYATAFNAYWELTNMTDDTIDLGDIDFAMMMPWGKAGETWDPGENHHALPHYLLAPGESYVIATFYDFNPKQYAKGLPGYVEKFTRDRMWELADLQIHYEEYNSIPHEDSITPGWQFLSNLWNGSRCFFLRQNINDTAWYVIDQVGGVFDEADGTNGDHPYDVAGVTDATSHCVLIRKYSVKTGNLDFANARGVGEEDSEWIVVRWEPDNYWRDPYWTVGNHGNYQLVDTMLQSDVVNIDFANKTITVPWGTRRGDDILHKMKQQPGLAWNYILGPENDSLTFAAQTGDKLLFVACGDVAQRDTFKIIVSDPTNDCNIVVPRVTRDPEGWWKRAVDFGQVNWPRVTRHESGQDTITGTLGGIPYGTRVDSLLKLLDFPPNATWEFIWVDGLEKRADLKNGDILRVTAENGEVKDYYIAVREMRPSHDANLQFITWPDIPDEYRGLYGWNGDTIPGFNPEVYNYRIQVPFDYNGIPSLVARPRSVNARVEVTRAQHLYGPVEGRSIVFKVTAEDDTTIRIYTVELVKEKDPTMIQPFYAEPFFSEYVEQEFWGNSYLEICNPGNQPLDLSHYLITQAWDGTDPAYMISMVPAWDHRYQKYIPGRKWTSDEAEWNTDPLVAQFDPSVNAIVDPGDVFVMAVHNTLNFFYSQENADFYKETVLSEVDVEFLSVDGPNYDISVRNQWGEDDLDKGGTPLWQWLQGNVLMYKILNDSVRAGSKPATDPKDFELIEEYGMPDASKKVICGYVNQPNTTYRRKPEYTMGNPVYGASFGINGTDCEWYHLNLNDFRNLGYGWPWYYYMLGSDLGKHFFNPPTYYMSTVTAYLYKVSEGYSLNESIRGVMTGTKVQDFLVNIFKADEGQTLYLLSSTTDGDTLDMTDVLNNGDTLLVISADGKNMTKYILDVNDQGLSHDAVLTSDVYTIGVDGNMGTIAGMDYGTTIREVLDNVNVPAGARLNVVNGKGAYVSLTMLNYDTAYVDVTVSKSVMFEVRAEDDTTVIMYSLKPNESDDNAFLISSVYEVDEDLMLVKYVPRGTWVATFLANVDIPQGATIKIVDKFGLDRTEGYLADDDKVIVTSASGNVTKIYYISLLATRYIPENAYLAYILSDTYTIDQLLYTVSDVPEGATVEDFLSNVTPAPGATVVIVDAEGNIKDSGALQPTDKVMVTSKVGHVTVYYEFTDVTAAQDLLGEGVHVFPNPTSGTVNISGVPAGARVKVFNALGSVINDFMANSDFVTLSLENRPVGIYIIELRKNDRVIGRYKLIKK